MCALDVYTLGTSLREFQTRVHIHIYAWHHLIPFELLIIVALIPTSWVKSIACGTDIFFAKNSPLTLPIDMFVIRRYTRCWHSKKKRRASYFFLSHVLTMFYYSRMLNSGRCFLLLLVLGATLLIADGQQQHNNNRSTLLRSMSQVRSAAPATTSTSSKTVRREVMQPFVSLFWLIPPVNLCWKTYHRFLLAASNWHRSLSKSIEFQLRIWNRVQHSQFSQRIDLNSGKASWILTRGEGWRPSNRPCLPMWFPLQTCTTSFQSKSKEKQLFKIPRVYSGWQFEGYLRSKLSFSGNVSNGYGLTWQWRHHQHHPRRKHPLQLSHKLLKVKSLRLITFCRIRPLRTAVQMIQTRKNGKVHRVIVQPGQW